MYESRYDEQKVALDNTRYEMLPQAMRRAAVEYIFRSVNLCAFLEPHFGLIISFKIETSVQKDLISSKSEFKSQISHT